ncbi:MAG: endolytic transglycosylase MltG [Candidatus Pacebacteria bacterium]|nr:endolytic transglycosylase MltG [Candidatus Paceibacterota bacterium]
MENFFSSEGFKHFVLDLVFSIKKHEKIISYVFGAIIFLVLSYFFLLSAPVNFPKSSVIGIDSGMSLRSVSALLKNDQVIRSRVMFEYSVIILGGEKHIVSADYSFPSSLSVWQVAMSIMKGEHKSPAVLVTIPEGFNLNQIADVCKLKLINFNETQFLTETENMEGYLFPDTYFFLSNANEEDVVKSMNENFQKKITPLLPQINASGHSEKDIITMASILEGEAQGDTDIGIISGILWKRIKIGMPLEVDSAPETYKTKGLPENPINNPGLEAILAAINPQSSPYLYYLHDKNGNIHYATTFAQHQANIREYLK